MLVLLLTGSCKALIVKVDSNCFSYTDNDSGISESFTLNIIGEIDYVAATRHTNQALSGFNIYIVRLTSGHFHVVYESSLVSLPTQSNFARDLTSSFPHVAVGSFSNDVSYFLASPQSLHPALRVHGSTAVVFCSGSQLQRSGNEFIISPCEAYPCHNLIPLAGHLQIVEEAEFGVEG